MLEKTQLWYKKIKKSMILLEFFLRECIDRRNGDYYNFNVVTLNFQSVNVVLINQENLRYL